MYIPFRALIEALQMRRYHEKFNFFQEKAAYTTIGKNPDDGLY
jgi:hypothetical protein